MVLWDECPDCKGVGGYWSYDISDLTRKVTQEWVPCEPCQGAGKVQKMVSTYLGPVDDLDEECLRG